MTAVDETIDTSAETIDTTAETIDTSAATFAERVFNAVLGAQEIQAAYLGHHLGWYDALAEHGPLTSVELAEHTATTERYAREWLEHQAVCGYVTCEDVAAGPTERRYALPAGHAEVMTNRDGLTYYAPLAQFVGGLGLHLDKVAEAYRTGGGVSWAELGSDAREAQAAFNRPLFLHQLGQQLLPSVPELHARLSAASARVADIGCGAGWSSIGIARAYPGTTVVGIDVDEPSIEMARRHAVEHGVSDRVEFRKADGAGASADETFDAVFAFECVHDVSDPVSVLSAMRELAGADGFVVVADELTEDTFTAPGGELERMLYGYSLTCCLPDGMAHPPSVGTGTVMRADTFADYAQAAGFANVEVLPIENDAFRFYRLHQ